jgi:mycothiol synthase
VCGYASLLAVPRTGRIYADAYTHPHHCGSGVGTALLEAMEARAETLAAELDSPAEPKRVVLVNGVVLGDSAEQMLRARDYTLVRVHARMRIELDRPQPEPEWPPGVTTRACDGTAEDLRRIHECVEDSFADHWGRHRRTYDEWAGRMIYEGFDPTLWLLAERDGRLVGVALSRAREVGGRTTGDVDQLGVRREARRTGLGLALLTAAFGLFAERGASAVILGVDSQSLTGADRLYRRAGMTTTSEIGRFELELRPGVDLLDRIMVAQQAADG